MLLYLNSLYLHFLKKGVDPDSLNKAVDLLFGLALGNNVVLLLYSGVGSFNSAAPPSCPHQGTPENSMSVSSIKA